MRSKKEILPPEGAKAGLLACSDHIAFPIYRISGLFVWRILELTAAGTAADFHGIPFSSHGLSPAVRTFTIAKLRKKSYLYPRQTKFLLKIMKHAYVFPGQGAQAVGMGKDLYDNVPEAKELFEKANEILGFRITDIMFAGTDEELKQTRVTQPAVFLHSVILAKALGVTPDAVAGHSLGEFSALVVAGALSFEDGLRLVSKRAMAMQAACEVQAGTMAAILGLEDAVVEEICDSIDGVVVAANYNCPAQLVISGTVESVDAACEKAKAAGARRALRLSVGGAFHSPLMEPARQELEKAIAEAPFHVPSCPIYQNVDARPYTDPSAIKANLIAQLTAPVRWTYIVREMLADGVTEFTELGPGNVLQGLIKKVNAEVAVESKSAL